LQRILSQQQINWCSYSEESSWICCTGGRSE
jgi:hypothetical protein